MDLDKAKADLMADFILALSDDKASLDLPLALAAIDRFVEQLPVASEGRVVPPYCRSCDHTHLVGTACWFATDQPKAVPQATCDECGTPLTAGEAKTFACCDACWDNTFGLVSPVVPVPPPQTDD